MQGLLPSHEPSPEGGRPRRDDREMLEAIIWRQRTGSPWRDVPGEFGPWQTAYTRWREWVDEGVLDDLFRGLQELLHAEGLLDHELWFLDSTTARAQKSAAGAPGACRAKKNPARAC